MGDRKTGLKCALWQKAKTIWMLGLQTLEMEKGPTNKGANLSDRTWKMISSGEHDSDRGDIPELGFSISLLCSSKLEWSALTCAWPMLWQQGAKTWTEGTATSASQAVNRGGWYPRQHWKDDSPVDEGRLLWAYSTQGNTWLQEERSSTTIQHKATSSYD